MVFLSNQQINNVMLIISLFHVIIRPNLKSINLVISFLVEITLVYHTYTSPLYESAQKISNVKVVITMINNGK